MGQCLATITADENRIYQIQLSNTDTTVSSAFRMSGSSSRSAARICDPEAR
ncbi:MAG: hypothetical protein U5K71_10630 [Gracilimonas sp.]|nr:hypothetical protein [Gracilimonas sp.]